MKMSDSKLVYRSLRRLLAELRETSCELRDYFEFNFIDTKSYISKYLENLKGYLNLVVNDKGYYEIADESIDTFADLLKIVQASNFNNDMVTLLFDYNVVHSSSVYTLIYFDRTDKMSSRFDTFVITRNV
jgi:hypothetical protein